MKIKFTRCSTQMYYDILEHYYETTLPKNIVFNEYQHSPAEVLEICSFYNNDIDKAIEKLISKNDNNQMSKSNDISSLSSRSNDSPKFDVI